MIRDHTRPSAARSALRHTMTHQRHEPEYELPAQVARAQELMRQDRIDGWLVHDFRGSSHVLARLVPASGKTTRRAALWVPASGEPELLCSVLDRPSFAGAIGRGLREQAYIGWDQYRAWLASRLRGGVRVAMEYSPGAALPAVSLADAGTVELVRAMGAEVASSADLIQAAVAVWSDDAVAAHRQASAHTAEIMDSAWRLIRERTAGPAPIDEAAVARHIRGEFDRRGLETPDGPIVAVNAHAGDPHYDTPATGSAPIGRGDWVLIDLWARRPGNANIFSDITWVGFVGREAPAQQREVFGAVQRARDAALALARRSWHAGTPVAGHALDDAARAELVSAGLGEFVRHRTGHSLSPGPLVHGAGMNLDNLETHDTRRMLPRTGFTIEPGAYLPQFGVRLEIDVYVDPAAGPTVTSCLQTEIVPLA
ncbi:MAG: hypothetical protein C0475_02485 [Planctomyces sp.]|nr:hypothetical protein [Planctomyces sp.]